MDFPTIQVKKDWKSLYGKIGSHPIVICRLGRCGYLSGELARCLSFPPLDPDGSDCHTETAMVPVAADGEGC